MRNPGNLYAYMESRITDDEMHYILLDEIQMLDEFENVLNGFLRKPNVDIYVTGSNAKFLSKDIITEFRGRGFEVKMHPLSFSEFMSAYPGTIQAPFKGRLNDFIDTILLNQLTSNSSTKMNAGWPTAGCHAGISRSERALIFT